MFFRFSSIHRKSKLLELRSEIEGVAPLAEASPPSWVAPIAEASFSSFPSNEHWTQPNGPALRKLTTKEGKSMNRTECSQGEL